MEKDKNDHAKVINLISDIYYYKKINNKKISDMKFLEILEILFKDSSEKFQLYSELYDIYVGRKIDDSDYKILKEENNYIGSLHRIINGPESKEFMKAKRIFLQISDSHKNASMMKKNSTLTKSVGWDYICFNNINNLDFRSIILKTLNNYNSKLIFLVSFRGDHYFTCHRYLTIFEDLLLRSEYKCIAMYNGDEHIGDIVLIKNNNLIKNFDKSDTISIDVSDLMHGVIQP